MRTITPEVLTSHEHLSLADELADLGAALNASIERTKREMQQAEQEWTERRQARQERRERLSVEIEESFIRSAKLHSGNPELVEQAITEIEAGAPALAPAKPAKLPTVKELRAMLKQAGIKGRWQRNGRRLVKADLVAIAREAGLI